MAVTLTRELRDTFRAQLEPLFQARSVMQLTALAEDEEFLEDRSLEPGRAPWLQSAGAAVQASRIGGRGHDDVRRWKQRPTGDRDLSPC